MHKRIFAGLSLAAALLLASPAYTQQPDTNALESRDLTVEQKSFLDTITSLFSTPGNDISINVRTNKNRYRIGELMTVSVNVDKDTFIYIFNKGSSGKTILLYPNAIQQNEQVKAGSTIELPWKGDKFEILVGGPAGRDIIAVVASSRRLEKGEREKLRKNLSAGRPFATLDRSDEEFFRDMSVQQAGKKALTATGVVEIDILP